MRVLNQPVCMYSSQYFSSSCRNTQYSIFIRTMYVNRQCSAGYFIHWTNTTFSQHSRLECTLLCWWHCVYTCSKNDSNIRKFTVLCTVFVSSRPRLGALLHRVVGVGLLYMIFSFIEGILRVNTVSYQYSVCVFVFVCVSNLCLSSGSRWQQQW